MRILYISLEFVSPFSGNGTASQSFVRAIAKLGNDVCVVCACPRLDGDEDVFTVATKGWGGRPVTGAVVPVDVWKVHGRASPYESFAAGLKSAEVANTIRDFASGGLDVVVGVDWEANEAYKVLCDTVAVIASVPYVYYNYRVYFDNTANSDEDTAFYLAQEVAAMSLSAQRCCICLCRSDAHKLEKALSVQPHVLLPALREDMRLRGLSAARSLSVPRKYLLSCVRLVPEKNIESFLVCIELLGEAWLEANGVVPLMLGAAADAEFGARVHARLLSACPAAEIHEFLPGDTIADAMASSLLNFHPALNEAYGMTIVEAAAMACPSIIHRQEIGAADFLSADDGEVLLADMAQPAGVADYLRELLAAGPGRAFLEMVGSAARGKALSYDELQNAQQLLGILQNPCPAEQKPPGQQS